MSYYVEQIDNTQAALLAALDVAVLPTLLMTRIGTLFARLFSTHHHSASPSPSHAMRRLCALMAAAMVPALLSAQSPATAQTGPTTANAVAQTFRSFGRPYGTWLLAAFDSIPASQYTFKPTPVQQSIGYIAQHLEDANYQLCARFGDRPRSMTAKDSLADTVKAGWPKDTLLTRLRQSFVFCNEAIAKLSDANLADSFVVGQGSPQQATVPRARFLILFVTDLAEHYSQIATYMRILGMVPPSALPQPTR